MANAGVVRDFVADQERYLRLRHGVQRAGPWMQINRLLFVKLTQTIVKLADGKRRGGFPGLTAGPDSWRHRPAPGAGRSECGAGIRGWHPDLRR